MWRRSLHLKSSLAPLLTAGALALVFLYATQVTGTETPDFTKSKEAVEIKLKPDSIITVTPGKEMQVLTTLEEAQAARGPNSQIASPVATLEQGWPTGILLLLLMLMLFILTLPILKKGKE